MFHLGLVRVAAIGTARFASHLLFIDQQRVKRFGPVRLRAKR
jgi:hypothetical protein